jgi:hypothetical protein
VPLFIPFKTPSNQQKRSFLENSNRMLTYRSKGIWTLGFHPLKSRHMKISLSALFVTSLLFVSSAMAQTTTPAPSTPAATPTGVIIYELNFKHVAGFNISFWDGGYIVVPATGGPGSAIFTSKTKGAKELNEYPNVVAFYPAKTDDKRYTIISMNGGTGTPTTPTTPTAPTTPTPPTTPTTPTTPANTAVSRTGGALVAMQVYGEVNKSIRAKTERFEILTRAADKLRGMAMASRDESNLSDQQRAKDGTSGFIEFAEMNLDLDEKLTNEQNDREATVSTATAELVRRLRLAGFGVATGGGTPPPTAPPTSPGGGSGPVSGPEDDG